jgi:hypothetical protein
MQQIVKYYNDKPHKSFDMLYSPLQVNTDEDLEGIYIR